MKTAVRWVAIYLIILLARGMHGRKWSEMDYFGREKLAGFVPAEFSLSALKHEAVRIGL
jgi:hypothetical protein